MKPWKTPKGTELPILDLRGKPYLQVAHRLVWFREERPTWHIHTYPVELTATSSFFRAEISDEKGLVMATAHKFEDAKGFPDHREKSETGAIGRALALCGYGTQFCADEFDEGPRLADSPVSRIGAVNAPLAQDIGPGDGFPPDPNEYRVDFGKWNRKSLEQIHREFGAQEMILYVEFLEASAKKKNVAIEGPAKVFIDRVEKFLGAVENLPFLSESSPYVHR